MQDIDGTRLNPEDVMMSTVRLADRSVLDGMRASTLMTPNPISITDVSTVRRAAKFLAEHHFSAAPVIDSTGRAVGVLSVTDIVRCTQDAAAQPIRTAYYNHPSLELSAEQAQELIIDGETDCEVRNIMTPMVIGVAPEASARQVIDVMLEHHVHRLFVIDETGILAGIITTFDVLRAM
jgi:CBS domain-containing protein